MKKFFTFSGIIILFFIVYPSTMFAQIYAPEGLNMPGEWNSWTNPPTNNLAFANGNQVTDGRITSIEIGTTRWQTTFHVAATGGDIEEGTFNWLFTSGPETDAFANKWGDVSVTLNTIHEFTYQGSGDNSITVTNDHWYTMNWEDAGYANTNAIFMETTNEPVDILTVSTPTTVQADEVVNINITTSATPSAEELLYVRYTTDTWATSIMSDVTITGTNGTATIPGQPAGTTVQYYVLSTTISGIISDYDLQTIKFNNNDTANYIYTIAGADPEIDWANLQYPESGTILTGESYEVYSQLFIDGITNAAGQAADVQAWIGYSTDNTDPSTWTNWIASSYFGDAGNNDEYLADLGLAITTEGTYYYASRFQYLSQDMVYGGFSTSGGGFWDGTTNVSGVLTINNTPPEPEIGWANLQYPDSGNIVVGQDYLVYAQVWIEDSTGLTPPVSGIQSWIGYSAENTDPSTWTNWVAADYSAASGSNDEFVANIGTEFTSQGTYYYASRFSYLGQDYVYGGYSTSGGGYWDGTANISGVVTVNNTPTGPEIGWANLQYPDSGNIEIGQEFLVYAQAWIEDSTGLTPNVSNLQSWIGYSEYNTDPATWTNWVAADYFGASGNNDEFVANIGTEITEAGIYYYASRFQYLDQDMVYGGYSISSGGFWDGTTNISGVLTVGDPGILFPVTFTATDATGLYSNIKFKGSMTNWEAIDMEQNGTDWKVTLNIAPGSYEWGVMEDDGSAQGIWLIIGPNLVVDIADDGIITGDTTYTITYVDVEEHNTNATIYPNPANDIITLDINIGNKNTEVTIYDQMGALVKTKKCDNGQNKIDISSLAPGIYLLSIDYNNRQIIRKIVKQ